MRARSAVALVVFALATSACATAPPDGPGRLTASGDPLDPVEGYDWFFHADGDAARLAYGLAESDDLRLGLDCTRASGRLSLSGVASSGARPEFHIQSDGAMGRFPAEQEPSQVDEGVFLSAEAPTAAPVFQRFRKAGRLALWRDGAWQTYASHPASAPDIERFFAFCG